MVGPPNAGKSTLLNRLAGRDAAMTSEIEGTTRDVIEVRMDLNGLPVTVLDTAGIRSSEDVLEEQGIARGQARAHLADVRIHLSPEGEFEKTVEGDGLDLFVRSKADQGGFDDEDAISAETGYGVSRLLDKVESYLNEKIADAGIATRERHAAALRTADSLLRDVIQSLDDETFVEDLVADDLRRAIRSLDSLIGRVDVENVLDEIFSSFCIGK